MSVSHASILALRARTHTAKLKGVVRRSRQMSELPVELWHMIVRAALTYRSYASITRVCACWREWVQTTRVARDMLIVRTLWHARDVARAYLRIHETMLDADRRFIMSALLPRGNICITHGRDNYDFVVGSDGHLRCTTFWSSARQCLSLTDSVQFTRDLKCVLASDSEKVDVLSVLQAPATGGCVNVISNCRAEDLDWRIRWHRAGGFRITCTQRYIDYVTATRSGQCGVYTYV